MVPRGALAHDDDGVLAQRALGLLVRRVMDDEVLVLPAGGGEVVRLGGTALELWSAVASPKLVAEIVGELASRYGVAGAQVSTDVHAAIETLAAAGLIELAVAS